MSYTYGDAAKEIIEGEKTESFLFVATGPESKNVTIRATENSEYQDSVQIAAVALYEMMNEIDDEDIEADLNNFMQDISDEMKGFGEREVLDE